MLKTFSLKLFGEVSNKLFKYNSLNINILKYFIHVIMVNIVFNFIYFFLNS